MQISRTARLVAAEVRYGKVRVHDLSAGSDALVHSALPLKVRFFSQEALAREHGVSARGIGAEHDVRTFVFQYAL